MKKNKHVLRKFIFYSFKWRPQYYLTLIYNSIITAATTIFGAYTLSLLINALENKTYKTALIIGGILVAVEVVLAFLGKIGERHLEVEQSRMQESVDHTICNKILSLEFKYLEDPYYLELKKNASMGVNNMGAVYTLMNCFSKLVSSIISIIGLASIIFSFDYIIVIILLVGSILNFVVIMLSMKSQIKFFNDLLPINYKYGYYFDNILSPDNCKDLRLYKTGKLVLKRFSDYSGQVNKYFVKMAVKQSLFESVVSTLRYIQMALIYILAGIKTISKNLPISSFSLIVSSSISFSDCVTKMIEASSDYFRAIEYIKPVIELLSLDENTNKGEKKISEIDSIRFEHVSFKYPKTDKLVLNDVSFEINKNEKISIVGLNGAGKTTIVKLLCRLYEPTKGQIYINDIPINEYENHSYINLVSAVFQDYKLFSYSILDNIKPNISKEEAKEIATSVGIIDKIESLDNGFDSIIGKSYDKNGIEMSGGQRQKIAIARALAKDASLLIMDEPTSALDPLAEADIYENFNNLSLNKTAIYISHRMSSSIFCDKILVLDGGSITDFDSHKNLMKNKDSLYYKLFTTQSKNYNMDKNI